MLCSGVRISEQVIHDFASLISSDIHRGTNRLLQSNIADITLHKGQELADVHSTELLLTLKAKCVVDIKQIIFFDAVYNSFCDALFLRELRIGGIVILLCYCKISLKAAMSIRTPQEKGIFFSS
jgi:hypothetical protein